MYKYAIEHHMHRVALSIEIVICKTWILKFFFWFLARAEVVKDYANQMIEALRACKFVIQQAAYRHLTKPSVRACDQ